MIQGLKTPAFVISLFCGVIALPGCDPQSKVTRTSAAGSPVMPWIREAVAIAEKIPTDLHAVEHDRSLSRTAMVAVELGVYDQTDAILNSIDSWRKADLYAKLARICYADGKTGEGDDLIEKARRHLRENRFEEWQVSRVHVSIEEAEHLKGEKTDASLLRQLEPADQARLLPSMVKGNLTATNLVEMLTRLEAGTNAVMDIDIASATVDTYRILYEESRQKEEFAGLRARVLAGVESTFRNLPVSIASHKLLDFCDSASKTGDLDFAGQLGSMVEERMATIRVDMRIPVVLRYAGILLDQGKKDKALERLRYVEENIDDTAVFFADRPVFLARCGVLYGRGGDSGKMRTLMLESIARLNSFRNARPRAVTAVDLCHVFAHAAVDSSEILDAMKELNSNLADPW